MKVPAAPIKESKRIEYQVKFKITHSPRNHKMIAESDSLFVSSGRLNRHNSIFLLAWQRSI